MLVVCCCQLLLKNGTQILMIVMIFYDFIFSAFAEQRYAVQESAGWRNDVQFIFYRRPPKKS
jgi:hypothetical protein